MATTLQPFSDEQARTLINLDQHYRVWRDAERSAAALPYNLAAKEVKGRRYLYELSDRTGNGRSLGPWNAQSDARLADYRTTKAAAKTRLETSREVLAETCRLYRALRLPLLSSRRSRLRSRPRKPRAKRRPKPLSSTQAIQRAGEFLRRVFLRKSPESDAVTGLSCRFRAHHGAAEFLLNVRGAERLAQIVFHAKSEAFSTITVNGVGR